MVLNIAKFMPRYCVIEVVGGGHSSMCIVATTQLGAGVSRIGGLLGGRGQGIVGSLFTLLLLLLLLVY